MGRRAPLWGPHATPSQCLLHLGFLLTWVCIVCQHSGRYLDSYQSTCAQVCPSTGRPCDCGAGAPEGDVGVVSSSSKEKTRLAAKEARQAAPCEPIFPAELRRRQAPMLNLPGLLAAWHRSATPCLPEAAAGSGFAVVAAVVCGQPLLQLHHVRDGNPAARQGHDLQGKCLRRFPSFGYG